MPSCSGAASADLLQLGASKAMAITRFFMEHLANTTTDIHPAKLKQDDAFKLASGRLHQALHPDQSAIADDPVSKFTGS